MTTETIKAVIEIHNNNRFAPVIGGNIPASSKLISKVQAANFSTFDEAEKWLDKRGYGSNYSIKDFRF